MELILTTTPYNGMKAKLGDVVYARRGIADAPAPPQKVVYVGEVELATEFPDGGLITYRKDTMEGRFVQAEQRILVNGFEVPAPLEKDPGEGQVVYVADPTLSEWHSTLIHIQISMALRTLVIARGLAHDTAAAAIAHAKAMAGVDPYAAPVFLDDAYDNLP